MVKYKIAYLSICTRDLRSRVTTGHYVQERKVFSRSCRQLLVGERDAQVEG